MNEENLNNAAVTEFTPEPQPVLADKPNVPQPVAAHAFAPQGLEPMKEVVTSDFKKIDEMIAQGRLSLQDGAELKNYVLEKAFGNSVKTRAGRANEPNDSPISQAIKAHEANNPGFFSGEQRQILKDYLLNNVRQLDLEGLGEITKIVEYLENAAVQRVLSDENKKNELLRLNEEAKTRMYSNVAANAMSRPVGNRRFTRAEIDKMSTKEFLEHEKQIMSQMKAGLL